MISLKKIIACGVGLCFNVPLVGAFKCWRAFRSPLIYSLSFSPFHVFSPQFSISIFTCDCYVIYLQKKEKRKKNLYSIEKFNCLHWTCCWTLPWQLETIRVLKQNWLIKTVGIPLCGFYIFRDWWFSWSKQWSFFIEKKKTNWWDVFFLH